MKDDKLGEAVIRDVIHEGVQDETYTVANLAMQEGKKKVIHRQKIQLFLKYFSWLYDTFWVFITENEYPEEWITCFQPIKCFEEGHNFDNRGNQ